MLPPRGRTSLRNSLFNSSQVTVQLCAMYSDNNTTAFKKAGEHVTELITKYRLIHSFRKARSGLS